MKIAVVAPHTTQICRPEVQVGSLKGFERFHVFLVASNLRKIGVNAKFFYLTNENSVITREFVNTPVVFCPVTWRPRREYGWELSFPLFKELKKFKPDLIHTFNYSHPAFWSLIIAAKLLRTPLVVSHTASNWVHSPPRRFRGKVFQMIQEFSMKKADRIIVGWNKREVDWLINELGYPRERILELIWLGIDTELFRPIDEDLAINTLSLDNNYRYLLTVGIIRTPQQMDKNPFELLHILKMLNEKRGKFHFKLIVVGSGSPENEKCFIDTANQLGTFDDVIMPGWIASGQKLADYYNAADVYLNTSEKDSGFGKGSAIGKETTIWEAMACGTPIITYATEYSRDDGCMIYIPNRDRELMAEKVLELMEDSKLRTKLIEHSLEDIRRNGTWPKVAESLKSQYVKVLQDRGRI